MLDPDAPSRKKHRFRSYVHWLVVNVLGNKVEDGTTRAVYRGPAPPQGTGLHRYVFLVYKQQQKVDVNKLPTFNTTNRGRYKGNKLQCLINNAGAMQLTLVAANVFQSQYDEYVGEHMRKEYGILAGPMKLLVKLLTW